jgi:DNA-binding response OmpR family regulator
MSKKVLIVEDDTFLGGLISNKLTKDGFDVSYAKDAKETSAMLEASKPDCILLDLVLPGTDGYGILKKIRENTALKNTPVIVFSNLAEEKDIAKAKELGADDFMIKSNFTLDEVSAKITGMVK